MSDTEVIAELEAKLELCTKELDRVTAALAVARTALVGIAGTYEPTDLGRITSEALANELERVTKELVDAQLEIGNVRRLTVWKEGETWPALLEAKKKTDLGARIGAMWVDWVTATDWRTRMTMQMHLGGYVTAFLRDREARQLREAKTNVVLAAARALAEAWAPEAPLWDALGDALKALDAS